MNLRTKKAQSLLEYAFLIGVIVAAYLAMNVYMQRAVQANLKLMEDKVNANSRTHFTLGLTQWGF